MHQVFPTLITAFIMIFFDISVFMSLDKVLLQIKLIKNFQNMIERLIIFSLNLGQTLVQGDFKTVGDFQTNGKGLNAYK